MSQVPQLSSSAQNGEITVSAPVTLSQRGPVGNAGAWSLLCPANQVLVGICGASGTVIGRLGFTCATLSGAIPACRVTSIALGGTSPLDPEGGNGGVPLLDSCPSGTVAAGHNLYVEQWNGSAAYVSAYSLTCSTMVPAATCSP